MSKCKGLGAYDLCSNTLNELVTELIATDYRLNQGDEIQTIDLPSKIVHGSHIDVPLEMGDLKRFEKTFARASNLVELTNA